MKRLIIFLTIPLLFASCEIFEDKDKRTYFKAEATGYVYYWHTKEPAYKNVRVTVRSSFRSSEWATPSAINEDFYPDSTGFFRIRFLKRAQRENVVGITVSAYDYTDNLSSILVSCTVDELDKLILKLDTLWIRY